MTTSNNRVLRTKKLVLDDIKAVCGGLSAAWAKVSALTLEGIDHHHNEGDGGLSIVGMLYNQLVEADHKTMANCLKQALYLSVGVTFKKDDEKEGRFIAHKVKGDKLAAIAAGFAENMAKLEKEGLKAFKPEKKEGSVNKVAKAMGALETLKKAIASNDKETIEALGTDLIAFMAMFTSILNSAGYGSFLKTMASTMVSDGRAPSSTLPTTREVKEAQDAPDKGGIVGYDVGEKVWKGNMEGTIIAMHDTTVIVRTVTGVLDEWDTNIISSNAIAA